MGNFGEFLEIEYECGEPYEVCVDDKKFVKWGFIEGAKLQSKLVAAYIRELLKTERDIMKINPADYTKGKIRGYEEILIDLESGELNKYMNKNPE